MVNLMHYKITLELVKYYCKSVMHIHKYSRTFIIRTSIIRTLDYPKSSGDCSIRVFCQQVYVLLEYFVKDVCPIRIVQQSSVYKSMDFIYHLSEHFCDSADTQVFE